MERLFERDLDIECPYCLNKTLTGTAFISNVFDDQQMFEVSCHHCYALKGYGETLSEAFRDALHNHHLVYSLNSLSSRLGTRLEQLERVIRSLRPEKKREKVVVKDDRP